jgi:hypothetical protein
MYVFPVELNTPSGMADAAVVAVEYNMKERGRTPKEEKKFWCL